MNAGDGEIKAILVGLPIAVACAGLVAWHSTLLIGSAYFPLCWAIATLVLEPRYVGKDVRSRSSDRTPLMLFSMAGLALLAAYSGARLLGFV